MKFSVITPCFNSSQTLDRAYKSLLNSSFKEFEWILVDDCSTDQGRTANLMRSIAASSPFPVKLRFLEKNYFGSKSTYEACLLAAGKFACILDHDDQLMPDCLSEVSRYLDRFDSESIAGVAGRCVNENGVLIGKSFGKDFFIGSEGDLRFKKRMTFETFQFTKTSILKSYFSELRPGYTNGYVWARISTEYEFIFIDKVLRIYDVGLPTSYSNNKKLHVVYPAEKAEALQRTLECYGDYLLWNPLYSTRLAASAVRHRLNSKKSLFGDLPNKLTPKIFYCLGIPLGYIKYFKNKIPQ